MATVRDVDKNAFRAKVEDRVNAAMLKSNDVLGQAQKTSFVDTLGHPYGSTVASQPASQQSTLDRHGA